MKVLVITATKGRHSCLERSVGMFLKQTYKNSVQLIYNNSCHFQRLNSNIPLDRVILINNCIDLQEKKPYTTLGAIYRDILTFLPKDVDIICHFDDDDLFLPTHIEEGVKGLINSGKMAYKPKKSYFLSGERISLLENTLEPSIFIKKEALIKYGYSLTTSDQHLLWVDGLLRDEEITSNSKGKPTLIYTWGRDSIFKTSGNSRSSENFNNYENFSKDEGDGIITPWSEAAVDKLFKALKLG